MRECTTVVLDHCNVRSSDGSSPAACIKDINFLMERPIADVVVA